MEGTDHPGAFSRRSRRLRRLVGGVVCLVVGAVTTVGVAWGLAYRDIDGEEVVGAQWADEAHGYGVPGEFDMKGVVDAFVCRSEGSLRITTRLIGQDLTTSSIPHPAPAEPLATKIIPPWAYHESLPWMYAGRPMPGLAEVRVMVARGFPALALYSVCEFNDSLQGHRRGDIEAPGTTSVHGASILGRSEPVSLPYLPIWRGILLNTVCYGAFWWLAFFGVGGVRRWRRRRCGRCVRCGYDLRGIAAGAVCPECGHIRRTAKPSSPSQSEQPGGAALGP